MNKLWSKIPAKDQRGFTLIELIVAVAITGIVIIGLSSAVFQLVAGNAKNSNHTTPTTPTVMKLCMMVPPTFLPRTRPP